MNTLKVGDKVRVVNNPGFGFLSVTDRDTILTVTEIKSSDPCFVKVFNGKEVSYHYYYYTRFEKVKFYKEEQEEWVKRNSVEIGTKVKIVKKVVPDNWLDNWVGSMDRYIGQEMVVRQINSRGIKTNCCYSFPFQSLEVVNMNESFSYKCRSKAERKAVLTYLLDSGYKWHAQDKWTADSIEERYHFSRFPVVTIRGNLLAGNDSITENAITLDQVFTKTLKKEPLTFEFENYDCTVTEDEMTFGCQTLDKPFITQLYEDMKGSFVSYHTEGGETIDFTKDGVRFDEKVFPYQSVLDQLEKVMEYWNEG